MIYFCSKEFKPTEGEHRLGQRLRTHVEHLAVSIGPRHISLPGTIDAAANYVAQQLAAQGETVWRFPYSVAGHEVANLVLERRGTTRPDEIVIIGAHYDTLVETPGADDNASAVAILLEVARLTHAHTAGRTIRFVAFPCEELPYYETANQGSRQYAKLCRDKGEKIVGMLCLEMVGYFTDEPKSQRIPKEMPRFFSALFPKRGNFLAAISNIPSFLLLCRFRIGFERTVRFPLYAVPLPEIVHSIRRSDHSSFWDNGYPAISITDTSLLRNPHYHKPTDLPDTLDYSRMARVATGVAGALMYVAKGRFQVGE